MRLYLFPTPITTVCTLTHDVAGWTIQSHPVAHPTNGAACQVFDLPDGTPNGNGATLTIPGAKGPTSYHGVLYLDLPTGAGLVIDVFPPVSAGSSLPRLAVSGQFLVQDVP